MVYIHNVNWLNRNVVDGKFGTFQVANDDLKSKPPIMTIDANNYGNRFVNRKIALQEWKIYHIYKCQIIEQNQL